MFTAANAREMSARSQAARRRNLAAKKEADRIDSERIKKLEASLIAVAPAVAERIAGIPALTDHSDQVNRLKHHIDRVDLMLDQCEAPEMFVKLTQSRASLQEQWAHLAGIPKPGSRRPGKLRDAAQTVKLDTVD